jgi:sugar phosphate isomerase/epimerase|uniref:Sugar phosphate isomerase/epimerase n=1 Tax=Schlesneria paludicola TaxID=360056 RepID=A0A7C4LLI2_9PLAN
MRPWSIGVFMSVDAGLGVHLDVAQELKIPTAQLHSPHANSRTPAHAEAFRRQCDAAGITLTCMFGGFEGESYADIATTARTVGLVPESTRAARLAEMKQIADFGKLLGIDAMGMHIGFVPSDRTSASYRGLVDATRELLDHLAHNGQNLHLETGQETADHLLEFIHDVGRPNLFINFDPANMILYGTGDPIAALRKVGHLVRSVHCKDARWAPENVRGKEWGSEVPLGEGDVGIETYLRTLHELGYTGPLTIEREIAHDRERQKQDIGTAVDLLTRLRSKILGD